MNKHIVKHIGDSIKTRVTKRQAVCLFLMRCFIQGSSVESKAIWSERQVRQAVCLFLMRCIIKGSSVESDEMPRQTDSETCRPD